MINYKLFAGYFSCHLIFSHSKSSKKKCMAESYDFIPST